LAIGSLSPLRDWGFAGDYVEAMWAMLQRDEPGDYVVATGQTHSIQELVATAFAHVGLTWTDHVVHDEGLTRPTDIESLSGDATKARVELGWTPRTSFEELIALMVDHDVAGTHAA
jgi:GDPmannose 4,6-dehydratase